MKPILVRIPMKTVSEPNMRDGWRARASRAKNQRMVVGLAMVPHVRVQRPLPCVVTLTRIAPRKLDDDNLRGALKAVRDGVADALAVRDNDPRIEWRYAQAKESSDGMGEMAVEIRVARRDV